MKILIIEDSKMFRMAIKDELSLDGYEFLEAQNGAEALDQLDKHISEIDLILLDLNLPDFNGIDLCKSIKKKYSDNTPPILILTGNDSLSNRVKGYAEGAIEFITKDFVKGELSLIIKKTISPDTVFEGAKILVIDDSKVCRDIVAEFFKPLKVRCFFATNAVEALAAYDSELTSFNLILTDLMMPEMSGIEFCKRVRREYGFLRLPIVIMSANPDRDQLLEAFKAGAKDYIIKPFFKEELIARVLHHLESSTFQDTLHGQMNLYKKNCELRDDLMAACSHDFKTPLNSILGFSSILSEEIKDTQQLEYLQYVKESALILNHMVEDLFLRSRDHIYEDIELKKMNVSEVITKAFQIAHIQAKNKGVNFNADVEQGIFINGNEGAFLRIINNLISNAIKFTSISGSIALSAKVIDNTVVVFISDTGIGISNDRLSTILDEKERDYESLGTKGEKGSGLGLNIVRKLVKALNGSVDVASQEGSGTEFKLTFPIA